MIYDPEPFVAYRQHGANLIGGNQGLRARAERLRLLAAGRLAEYTDTNLAALDRAAPLLTAEARAKIALFRRAGGCPCSSGSPPCAGSASIARPGATPLMLWVASATRLL